MNHSHRVLVQLDNLELGGAQINAVQLSAAVAEHGFDTLLVGPRHTMPARGPSLLDVGIDYGVTLMTYERPSSLFAHARTLSSLAQHWRAGVVHSFAASERAAYWGAGLFGRRALVRTMYEMSFDPRTHPSMPIIVGTGYLRDELASHPGGATLISPPVDTSRDVPSAAVRAEFRQLLGLTPDMIALVMVSRLTDEMKARGITDAIRAVDHLDDPRVRLVLVGTGDAEERLRSIAEEVNARHRRTSIIFPGPLSDPRPAYDAADIVVGMGSSAGRGLAFGKPLVVVGEYGWSAIFREPDTDAIFRNSFWSSQEVADGAGLMTRHLRELVENPSERARLAVGARRFAETNFGLPAMALRLAGVYEDAVRSASARAWIGDLRMEARILAAKLERSGRRLVPGGPAGGRISAALTWEHRRQDEMPIAKEPVR